MLVGVSYKTAWLLKHKLLEVMFQRESPRRFSGRVELDDAYLCGEHEGKAVRGSENKVPYQTSTTLAGWRQLTWPVFLL